MLNRSCDIYSGTFGNNIDYKGETPGAIMFRGVDVEIITKRIHTDQATKYILMERQHGRFSECDEKLLENGLRFVILYRDHLQLVKRGML